MRRIALYVQNASFDFNTLCWSCSRHARSRRRQKARLTFRAKRCAISITRRYSAVPSAVQRWPFRTSVSWPAARQLAYRLARGRSARGCVHSRRHAVSGDLAGPEPVYRRRLASWSVEKVASPRGGRHEPARCFPSSNPTASIDDLLVIRIMDPPPPPTDSAACAARHHPTGHFNDARRPAATVTSAIARDFLGRLPITELTSGPG